MRSLSRVVWRRAPGGWCRQLGHACVGEQVKWRWSGWTDVRRRRTNKMGRMRRASMHCPPIRILYRRAYIHSSASLTHVTCILSPPFYPPHPSPHRIASHGIASGTHSSSPGHPAPSGRPSRSPPSPRPWPRSPSRTTPPSGPAGRRATRSPSTPSERPVCKRYQVHQADKTRVRDRSAQGFSLWRVVGLCLITY
jgi:hypothetical protein